MELNSTINSRKSVRSFTKKRVNWKDLLAAIEAALEAPCAGNQNNLNFIIIQDKENINKLSKYSDQSWIDHTNSIIIVCSDETNLENMYSERGRIYSRQQAGAAIENLLLKLTDLGLSSCWIGAFSDRDIRLSFHIPENKNIEALIPIGYASNEGIKEKRKEKKKLDAVIRWEDWNQRKKPTPFKEPLIKYE